MMARVIHFEILSNDPDRAGAFYRDALGWEVRTWDGPQQYVLLTTGPADAPGINGALMGRHFSQAVINTVEVSDLAAVTKKIEECGGERVHGPNEIPGVGTHAYFTDPDGTLFGVLQPAMDQPTQADLP